jgi:hypothetical protein
MIAGVSSLQCRKLLILGTIKKKTMKMTETDWYWKGRLLEYCSCNSGCPCETIAPPTQGHCDGVMAFQIDEGHYGDVSLDGVIVAATFYFPRAIHHGGGHMQPIFRPETTEEQQAAISDVSDTNL